MKAIIKRFVALVCSCCFLVLLPGCWDYQAINTRSAVIGLGIDPAQDDPDKIRVTIQFPILNGTKGGSTQGKSSGETSSFKNLSTESYSITEALKRLQTKMDRHFDVAELHAVVLSRQLSGDAMDSVIEQLMRLPKINRLAFLLTTPQSAEKIMNVRGTESVPMDFVDNAFKVYKLSMYQVICVVSTSFLPLLFWIYPRYAAFYGGIDGQWALLGACLVGLFSAVVHGLLTMKFRTETGVEMLTAVFGKFIGKTVGASFVPGYLLFVAVSLYSFSITVKGLLPNTPRLAAAIALAFVAVIGALYGLETIARVASIAFPVVMLVLGLSFILAFSRGTWTGILLHPVSYSRSISVAGLLLPMFLGINFYLMVNPYFDHRKRNAVWLPILAVGLGCLYVIGVFIVIVRVVGYEGLRVLAHPVDFVLQLVQVHGFIIQRFGITLIFVSTMFQAVFYANHLWGLSELSRRTLNLNQSSEKWFTLGYAVIVLVIFNLIPNQEVGDWIVINILVPLSWLYLVIEPMVKLTVFYMRRRHIQPAGA